MPPARADYLAPWWAAWLHGLPHRGLRLQPVPADFHPRDPDYQQVRTPRFVPPLPWVRVLRPPALPTLVLQRAFGGCAPRGGGSRTNTNKHPLLAVTSFTPPAAGTKRTSSRGGRVWAPPLIPVPPVPPVPGTAEPQLQRILARGSAVRAPPMERCAIPALSIPGTA